MTQKRNGLRVENGAHHQTEVQTPTSVSGSSDTRHVARVVRVSTDAQDTQRQVRSVTELAERHFPDLTPVDYYDDGTSAYHVPIFDRPRGKELIAAIEQRKVAAIVTDAQDRLSRGKLVEWALFAELCRETGTRIVTAQQGELRLDQFEGEFTGAAFALFARKESADKSHRIASGKAERAREGRPHHGQLPPGYDFNKETRSIDATDDLQVMTEIFRGLLEGKSRTKLCAYATENISEEALTRHRGKLAVDRRRLLKWLRHPLYAGFTVRHGETYPGKHTPAVDLITFEKVQAKLDRAADKNASKEPHEWPFAGIAKCGECGRSLRYHPTKNKYDYKYAYAVCADPVCRKKHKAMHAAAVEANVLLPLASTGITVADLLTQPSFGVPTHTGPSLEQVLTERDEARAEVLRLGELVAERALDRDDPRYQAALARRQEADRAVEKVSTSAQSYRDELAALSASILTLADLADEDELAGQRFEETVTYVDKQGNQQTTVTMHNGNGPTLLQLLDGWRKASFDQRREILTRALEEAHVGTDSTRLHFRTAPPQPLVTETALPTYQRDVTRDLQAEGFGWVGSSYEEICPEAPRQYPRPCHAWITSAGVAAASDSTDGQRSSHSR